MHEQENISAGTTNTYTDTHTHTLAPGKASLGSNTKAALGIVSTWIGKPQRAVN